MTIAPVDLQVTSTPFILHRCFSDVDELAIALSVRRQVQINQLSLRGFQCKLLLAKFDQVQFLLFESACPLQAIGPKDGDFIEFACILRNDSKNLISHNVEITPETLFGFDTNREINLILPANLKLASIQICRSTFDECLQLMGRSDIDQRFLEQNFLRSPILHGLVSDYLKELFWLASNQIAFLRQSQIHRLVLEDFLPLLVCSIPHFKGRRMKSLTPLRRAQLVQQAQDYMRAHLDQPLTLKELCIALSTSSRALNYGFQDVFDMSPMVYLKVLRLQELRRALNLANPETTTIGDIAAQFGFWSLGHLSRDYQTMFGEKLSQTLNRQAIESKLS